MKQVTDMNTIKDNKRRYITGLDGLRALAVLAVIAYHFDWNWASGGLVGVGVFFVLSGYLITDLLLDEQQRNGRINWKQFWIRRAGMIRILRPTRGKLALLTIAGAALSFAAMALMYVPGEDPSRVYYGTDTRAFGLPKDGVHLNPEGAKAYASLINKAVQS